MMLSINDYYVLFIWLRRARLAEAWLVPLFDNNNKVFYQNQWLIEGDPSLRSGW
jgi:hypothetical protein